MKKKRIYYWKGVNTFNQLQKSELIAGNIIEAKLNLTKNQVTPLNINAGPYLRPKHFKKRDLLTITRHLTTMLGAGIPITDALRIIIDSHTNPFWRSVLVQITADVRAGYTLAESVQQFPMSFPKIFRQLIAAGEQTGQLIACLHELTVSLQTELDLAKKIKQALRYPIFLGFVTLLVTLLMLFFLLPQFEQIYATFQTDLPWFTHFTLHFAGAIQRHSLQLILLNSLIGFICYFLIYKRHRRQWQRVFLSLPQLGPLLQSRSLYHLFHHLMLTQKAAIPLVEGMKMTEAYLELLPYQQALAQLAAKIQLGDNFSTLLRNHPLFPSLCRQYIRVGEESGTLDVMLEKLADHYQQQNEERTQRLIGLIEPIMMLVLCLIIGSLVLALYLPIINLGEVIL